MRGSHVTCGEHAPFRIVPERGQVTEDAPEESPSVGSKQPWYVLQDREPGSSLTNAPGKFGPQPSLIILTSLLACHAHGLAGKSTTHNVYRFGRTPIHLSDIIVSNNVWPVFGQHRPTKRVYLDLPASDHADRLQTDVEATDPSEEAAYGEPPVSAVCRVVQARSDLGYPRRLSAGFAAFHEHASTLSSNSQHTSVLHIRSSIHVRAMRRGIGGRYSES